MILMNNAASGVVRGRRQFEVKNQDNKLFAFGNGKEVVVLVGSVYNGPNHKALPAASPGDVIVIAGGPYAFDLIKQGLVVAVEDYVEPAATTEPDGGGDEQEPQDEENPWDFETAVEASPWDFWKEAGLSSEAAQVLYEAGYTSAAELVRRFGTEGLGPVNALAGIGRKRAQTAYKWAIVNQ